MSGTLAIILGILAGILILVGLGAIWMNRRNNGTSKAGYQVPAASVRSPEEELNALGILEIKPRTAKSGQNKGSKTSGEELVEIIDVEEDGEDEVLVAEDDSATKNSEAATTEVAPAPDETEPLTVDESTPAPSNETASEAATDVRSSAEDEVEPDTEPAAALAAYESGGQQETDDGVGTRRGGVSRREALFRMLNAVQASVDGYTACLIRRDADGRCHVEAIVSQDPKSLGPESMTLDELLDVEVREGTAVVVKDIDAGANTEEVLGYYGAPVSIRQVAIAPIKAPGVEDAYFLLVDALGWQDLDDPWQRLMIGQFSSLLGTFMSTPITEGDMGEFIKPRIRPRREIIAEEIQRARAGKRPLALALIYLNRAEAIAEAGGKAISDAERAMANRLELAVNEGRLERFGELTYGIFQDEGVSEVEAWALQLQDELVREGDYFEGGVSIGIALLQDRHNDADDFRADATEALREAFETGACTIIE